MTKTEERAKNYANDLLLKDLCGRLLYGVKGIVEDGIKVTTPSEWPVEKSIEFSMRYMVIKNGWKPYLFPLSSMTEEHSIYMEKNKLIIASSETEAIMNPDGYDFLNKNHYDYRGLIEKGLAIDATEMNVY
jgi:hypothetical protein